MGEHDKSPLGRTISPGGRLVRHFVLTDFLAGQRQATVRARHGQFRAVAALADRWPFVFQGSPSAPGLEFSSTFMVVGPRRIWLLVCLGRSRTERDEDFRPQRGNLLGVGHEHTVGIVGGASHRQVEDRTAEVGDRDQVALISGVDLLLGGRIFDKARCRRKPSRSPGVPSPSRP